MSGLPVRKDVRLKHYDYALDGYYFATVVTRERLPLLKNLKKEIEQCINELPGFITGLGIDFLVVMDNHIHVIFVFNGCDRALGQVIRTMKYNINKNVGVALPCDPVLNRGRHGNAAPTKGIWQRNYHEHVIRNERALAAIREYSQNNPEVETMEIEQFYRECK